MILGLDFLKICNSPKHIQHIPRDSYLGQDEGTSIVIWKMQEIQNRLHCSWKPHLIFTNPAKASKNNVWDHYNSYLNIISIHGSVLIDAANRQVQLMSIGGQQCTQGPLMSTSFQQTKNVACQTFVSWLMLTHFFTATEDSVIPADRLVLTTMELVW